MSLQERRSYQPDNREFRQFGFVPLSEEEALAIVGSKEELEDIRRHFCLPDGDPQKYHEIKVKTYAKLSYDPENKQWKLFGYHYDGEDTRSIVDAVKEGYKGFLEGEKGTMEYVDGEDLTQAADRAEIFRLATKVGVVIPLFNYCKLQVIGLRPKLKFRIFGNLDNERGILEVRQALKARKPLLAPDAEELTQQSLKELEDYEKKYGEPRYNPNDIEGPVN